MKGLEALERIRYTFPFLPTVYTYDVVKEWGEIIEKELKALEIIKEKNVDIWILKSCLTLEQYNYSITKMDNCNVFNLVQEEFDLLKEVLCNE